MGVMACDRSGCDNVMCDLMVDNSYVCNECANEFREAVGTDQIQLGEMLVKFRQFMQSEKVCASPKNMVDVDEFFRRR